MTHTPGPWRADIKPISDIYIRRDNEPYGHVTATVYRHFGEEESKANARLIAASPELLNAAEDARAVLENRHHASPETVRRCLSMLSAAIKKAEGKS